MPFQHLTAFKTIYIDISRICKKQYFLILKYLIFFGKSENSRSLPKN